MARLLRFGLGMAILRQVATSRLFQIQEWKGHSTAKNIVVDLVGTPTAVSNLKMGNGFTQIKIYFMVGGIDMSVGRQEMEFTLLEALQLSVGQLQLL